MLGTKTGIKSFAAQQLNFCPAVFKPFSSAQRAVPVQRPKRVNAAAALPAGPAPRRLPKARRVHLVMAQADLAEMEVKTEELSTCTRKLTVTVPKDIVQQCFHTTVENLRKITGNLQGFRKDKIPLSMIITQCGGQRAFKRACLEEVMLTAMQKTMAKLAEPVVPNSERIISNPTDMEAAFDPAKPFTFVIEYDTVPPVKWKKSYRDIEVSIQDNGNFETDTAAVQDLIRQYLKEKGHQKVVVDRGLQQGDTAIVDFKFTEVGSRIPLPGLSSDRASFDTDVDPLNLTQHLLGAKVGEERKFEITLPSDYHVDLWQNMHCTVEVRVRELFSWSLPTFDDEFVKANFPKFESAEEMKKSLLATTAMERLRELDMRLGDEVQKAVVECVEIEQLPEGLVLDMGATMYRAMLLQMIEQKRATREEVERMATEEMVEEYCTKRRKELEDYCKFNIAADEIYATEGLTLDEEDVKAEVDARKQQYQAQQVEFDESAIRDQVVDTFKHVKVVEWLKDNVKRNIIPWKPAASPQ